MPLTPEQFRDLANANTGDDATDPDIIQLTNGNVLIAFASGDQTAPTDSAGSDIRGQIYNPEGEKVGFEIRLNNSRFSDSEFQPAITALAGGGFAIAYNDFEAVALPSGITFESDVRAEVYNATGTLQRSVAITDNGPVSGAVFEAFTPDIASTSATSALVTWINQVNGDVEARHFNPLTGATLGEFTVFQGATGADQGISTLAMTALNNGNYAVLYGDNNLGNDNLYLQITDNDSNAGARITVSSAGDVDDVSVTTLSNGNIGIAYTVDGSGGSNNGVRHAIYTQTGTLITTNQIPSTTVAGNQTDTAVAALDDGGFIVFWFDEDTFDLHGQRIASNGAKVGNEFDVVNFGGTGISNIAATALEDGRVQVTWQEEFSSDDVGSAIYDTRDNANLTPTSAGLQIGTIGNDVFDVAAGATTVRGMSGNDRISVDRSEVDPALTFDGGAGTDVLVIEDIESGSWNFTGESVRNFEEIEFEATVQDFDRTANFFASQLTTVQTFDFDGGSGSVETLRVFAGATSTLDYSGVAIEGFTDGEDAIEYIGDNSAENITGTSRGELFDGGNGADTLNGGGGNDTFIVDDDGVTGFYNGGTGSDTLDFSSVSTGFNLDIASFPSGAVVIGATVATYTSIENIIGGSGGDNLRGAGEVRGGNGDDLLRGSGNNTVFGEGDDDNLRITTSDGSPNFDGGNGTDTFNTSFLPGTDMYVELGAGYRLGETTAGAFDGTLTGIENYFGDSGEDVVIGDGEDNHIRGNSGNDTLDGGGGNDTLDGGDFGDLLLHSLGSDTFIGGGGTDTVDYSSSAGSVVADLLNSANNALSASGDTFTTVENLVGSSFTDVLTGNTIANRLTGNGGNDTYNGGDGNDTMIGGAGDETFNGGNNFDTVDYSFVAGDELVFNLGANFFGGSAEAGDDTINGIEHLILGEGNDRVFGSDVTNFLQGNDGDDTLSGLGGNDSILGEGDRDALSGGSGNDTLRGGDQDDRLFGNNDNDFLFGDGGDDLMNGGNGDDFVSGGADDDNAVVGGNDNDTVLGDGGNDGLSGGNGDDSVNGGIGDDRVFGGQGEDTLMGDLDNDTMGGGSENDVMFGGSGNDAMNGNTGNDTMDGGTGMDTMFGSNGNDVIKGGNNDGASDLLSGQGGLDTYVFEGNWGTDQIARYGELVQGGPRTFNEVIDMSGTTANSFAELQIEQIGNSTFVNIFGDAANSIEILFQNAAGITSADFIF